MVAACIHRKTTTDQRGVTHTYLYDDWGRLTEDRVTDYPDPDPHFDDSVLAVVTAYNAPGQTATVTGYDSATGRDPGNVVNQVEYDYDDWGNVTDAWQEHDGVVDNDEQGEDSVKVGYTYDSLARPATVVYPASRTVRYDYGATGGMDDRLSRIESITNGADTETYAVYTYLGADTIIQSDRPEVTGGLMLTYGDSSDDYSGFDRFGRIIDQLWQDTSGTCRCTGRSNSSLSGHHEYNEEREVSET